VPYHLCDPAVDSEQFRWDLKTPDIRNVSALEYVLRNRGLQIDIYLITYLLTNYIANLELFPRRLVPSNLV